MNLVDVLNSGNGNLITVEIEPPTLGKSINDLWRCLDPLVNDYGIRFIDITYHVQRTVGEVVHNGKRFPVYQKRKPGTAEVAAAIMSRYGQLGVEPVPHVICAGFNKYETEEYLAGLGYLGIKNILAVRGDMPKENGSRPAFVPAPAGHAHADGLLRQIRQLEMGEYIATKEADPLVFESRGAAAFPEKHPESPSWEREMKNTRLKVENGANYLVTQAFLDVQSYRDYMERVRQSGIDVPVVPGILPIGSVGHVKFLRDSQDCGASFPPQLAGLVEKYWDRPAELRAAGVDWATRMCIELRECGAPSLHFYAHHSAPSWKSSRICSHERIPKGI